MGQNMTTKVTTDTNRKLHARFLLVPKSKTLDDPERPLRTVSKYMRFRSPPQNFNEDEPIPSEVEM